MAGYMEGYGAGDEVRDRWIKRLLYVVLPAALLLTGAFFYFRTWTQERTLDAFLDALRQQKYEEAYAMWCTAERPCRHYPLEKFKDDWGPEGQYKDLAALQIGSVDYCGDGVVFEATYPNTDDFGLWVERSTNLISFAPWQRCPGKHLQFGPLLKKIFG